MNTFKNIVLQNWNFTRVLRLLLGSALCFQGIKGHDWFSGLLGVFLLYQGVMNVGCCGTGACASPFSKKLPKEEGEPVAFEEVKSDNNQVI